MRAMMSESGIRPMPLNIWRPGESPAEREARRILAETEPQDRVERVPYQLPHQNIRRRVSGVVLANWRCYDDRGRYQGINSAFERERLALAESLARFIEEPIERE